MGIVWVVEKPNTNRSSAAEMLMGNFAVRAVASLSSLQRLMSLSKSVPPQVLIINLEESAYSVEWMESLITYDLPNCERLYIRSKDFALPLSLSSLEAELNGDEFLLSRRVDDLLNRRDKRYAHVVQYKGVKLDVLNSIISFVDEDRDESIPRKETLILKVLFENPGSCTSREGLQESVWSGAVVSPRTINSHVSRLRKRLSSSGLTIESVYGGGYILI